MNLNQPMENRKIRGKKEDGDSEPVILLSLPIK